MREGARQRAGDFETAGLPEPHRALVGGDDEVELHGGKAAASSPRPANARTSPAQRRGLARRRRRYSRSWPRARRRRDYWRAGNRCRRCGRRARRRTPCVPACASRPAHPRAKYRAGSDRSRRRGRWARGSPRWRRRRPGLAWRKAIFALSVMRSFCMTKYNSHSGRRASGVPESKSGRARSGVELTPRPLRRRLASAWD